MVPYAYCLSLIHICSYGYTVSETEHKKFCVLLKSGLNKIGEFTVLRDNYKRFQYGTAVIDDLKNIVSVSPTEEEVST